MKPCAIPCTGVSMHTAHACRNLVNVKSEPTWLMKTLQYMLSPFEHFLFTSCSFSIYGGLTSLIPFSQSRLHLRSTLISALDSAKHTHCEGPAALSFLFLHHREIYAMYWFMRK